MSRERMFLVGAKDRSRVKKSIVPGYVVALLLLIVLCGCEKKSDDAVVIRKDYGAAVKQGEEVRAGRATNHDQMDRESADDRQRPHDRSPR